MYTNNTNPIGSQPPLPTTELWDALIVIFKHYFLEELGRFRFYPDGMRPPAKVVEAVRLLDCWLDVARSEGWLDGVDLEG